VGSVLGELLAGSLLAADRRTRLVVPLAAAGFVPVLLFAFAPSLPVAITLLVLSGLGTSYLIGLDQLALATVPEEIRRRAFTLLQAGSMVSQGLGFAAAGAVAERLPVTTVIPLLAACGLAAVTLVGVRLRRAHPAAAAVTAPPVSMGRFGPGPSGVPPTIGP